MAMDLRDISAGTKVSQIYVINVTIKNNLRWFISYLLPGKKMKHISTWAKFPNRNSKGQEGMMTVTRAAVF